MFPQTRSKSIHGAEEPFRLDVMQPFQKHSSWWLGRAPQHPLLRASLFHGVKHGHRFDVMQIFNKVETNGWSCSPKHGPVPFTVLKNLYVWMLCSHFKNIQVDGLAALPNVPCHGPAQFTAINMGIVLMLCRLSTTFKWTAGRASPNTVQLNSRCWINFLSGWRKAL